MTDARICLKNKTKAVCGSWPGPKTLANGTVPERECSAVGTTANLLGISVGRVKRVYEQLLRGAYDRLSIQTRIDQIDLKQITYLVDE